MQVLYTNSKEKTTTVGDLPIVKGFIDGFPKDIPGLPSKRDVDFTIELITRVSPLSRGPYRMSVPELAELKIKFQELLDKKYIHLSVSSWGASMLSVRENDGTLIFCIHYRQLNKLTVKNKYPLHHIDALFDQVNGPTVFLRLICDPVTII